ncbi:hypothetical protein [Paenibacillus phage SV21]|nr:hypothetical protein [Paenibacillus phage SV21]
MVNIYEGTLVLNALGRYEIDGTSIYFTSGDQIEYLVNKIWKISRVEHNGEDYYIVADPGLKMLGLTARTRI